MLYADNGRFIYLYTQSSRVRSEGLGFSGKPLKDGVSTLRRAVFAPWAFEWCILSAKFKNATCIFPPSTWRPPPERVFFYRPLELRRVHARYTRAILWQCIFHKSRRFSSGQGLLLLYWWRASGDSVACVKQLFFVRPQKVTKHFRCSFGTESEKSPR